MIELVRRLNQRGTPVGIISNSEGHLAELVDELGWANDFRVVVDSGRLGIDKPDPADFCAHLRGARRCRQRSAARRRRVGSRRAGRARRWRERGLVRLALHFIAERALPERVYGASNASELFEILAGLGLVS